MFDTKKLFKDFNHSKFVVFVCILPFSILLSLKLDGYFNASLWIVFTPLWILKLIVILGALIGSVEWCRRPHFRNERDSYQDFKAMIMTLGMHLLLLVFEFLLCNKIENDETNMWVLVFMPLFLVSPVAVGACVWGFKNDRSLEMEALLSVNILLFIFVALRLDGIIDWSWTAIFIPLWIVMCLPGIAVLYYFIWTLLFFRSTFPGADRRAHLSDAFQWIMVVIPVLTFEVLLAYRLDNINQLPWINIFIPLYISLIALIWSSFGRKGGNKWWFGLRQDFCSFLLQTFPGLQIYGNVAYKKSKVPNPGDVDPVPLNGDESSAVPTEIRYHVKSDFSVTFKSSSGNREKYDTVVPVMQLETPD